MFRTGRQGVTVMQLMQSVMIMTATGLGLLADGVAVTNSTREIWRLRRIPAIGSGHWFVYEEEPGREASRGVPWAEVPDWMDIDFPTPAGGRDQPIEARGGSVRIDLIGNGDEEEGFHLLDSSGLRRGTLIVARRAPEAGRPAPTTLHFMQRAAPVTEAAPAGVRFEQDGKHLEIFERRSAIPAGLGLASPREASPQPRFGGAGSAFSEVPSRRGGSGAGDSKRKVEWKEERK